MPEILWLRTQAGEQCSRSDHHQFVRSTLAREGFETPQE